MEEIALLVPTRSRVELFTRLKESWEKTTSGKSVLVPIVDIDELHIYADTIAGTNWMPSETSRPSAVEKLNQASAILSLNYPVIGFVSDDFVFHTQGWEDKIVEWQRKAVGIAYCNDLLQGASLPCNVFIHSDIIRALGFMAPTELKHYYNDNYWLDLGLRLKRLKYFHDIIIEHKHWSNNKAQKDELYSSTENAYMTRDREAWDKYRGEEKKLDRDITTIGKYEAQKILR